MLCSFSPPAGTSQWLHRLRSSKGFPDSDHINLEHFLSDPRHKIDPPICTDSAPPHNRPRHLDGGPMTDQRDDNGAIHGGDVINNVLSELFYMGEFEDLSRIRRKKSCRKQPCPRICVISKNSDRKDKVPSTLPSTLSNRRTSKELKVRERVEEEEERGHCDLSAYSQTEVTVIDTSVPSWKFEKTLFRRKNVWKVGEKKGKGLTSGDKKKRRASLNENGDGGKKKKKKKLKLCSSSFKSGDGKEGGEKKKKKKRFKACNSLKFVDKEEAMVPTNSTQGSEQGKRMVAACEKKDEVQEKSFFKKQIDGGGSSVILIKSIPTTTTTKKDVSAIPKSFVHK